MVITIIILLILAGVTITALTGDNGLLTKAGEAKDQYEYSQAKEQVLLVMNEYTMNYARGKLKNDNLIIDWLSNQKNSKKSIDDFTYDTTKKIMGLKKDRYMFYFNSDGTEMEMYKIEYILNGGTNEENAVTSYSGSETVQLPVPTKNGALFLGWSRDMSDKKNTINIITSDMQEDITLYAIWLEETPKEYFNFETNTDGQTAAITGFSDLGEQKYDLGEIKTLSIPTKDKNGLTVTTINNYSFSERNKIEELIIPETITILHGYETFKNCTGIKYLRIPISLWVSDNSNITFTGVSNIEEIYFSKGTGIGANYVETIGQLTNYQYTPWYLSRAKLTRVTLESEITSIGSFMFCGCNNIINTWDELINNREELANIGAYAFKECSKITGELSLPSKVTEIYNGTFTGDTGITRLTIPDTITKINTWETFKNCTGIKFLRIPISLWDTSVTNSNTTFSGVTNIEEIYFSKGTGIGVIYTEANAQYTPWYISRGKLNRVALDSEITSIGNYMFFGCNNISNTWEELINNKDNLTTIGPYAFKECTKITGELSLPSKVTEIRNGTFTGCIGITRLIIPDTITNVTGWETFKNCTGINYLKIPISLWVSDNFGSAVFNGVTNIQEVYFTKGTGTGKTYVNTAGNTAYYQYTPWYLSRAKLTKLTLEKGITSIGNYTLNGCNNISQIKYTGTSTEWNEVVKGSNNSILSNVTVQCEN